MPTPSFHQASLLLARGQRVLSDDESHDVITGLVWLVLAAVVLGVVFWVIRKRYGQSDDKATSVGFTLEDMRRLHEQGELSDEEFEQARLQMIAQGRKMIDKEDGEDFIDSPETVDLGLLETTGNDVDKPQDPPGSSDKIDL